MLAVATGALAAVITVGSIFTGRNKPGGQIDNNAIKIETEAQDDYGFEGPQDYAVELEDAEKGIIDGYDQFGMWLSENKPSQHAFASAAEVAEICNNDEVEMVKYAARNQVESFADYLANLPEQLQPEGFKGLSLIDTEKRLESLSDDEYETVLNQFYQIMDKVHIRRRTVNGSVENAYMREKDPNGAVTHDNMELVGCTTNESNLVVSDFYWTDDGTENGNEIGNETIKIIYNEDGSFGGCLQVITINGEKTYIYQGLEIISEDGDHHSDGEIHHDGGGSSGGGGSSNNGGSNNNGGGNNNPGGGGDNPGGGGDNPGTPGWGKSGDPHSGEHRAPSGAVDPAAEVSQAQNEATNAGNQGYVNDGGATPGSGSESSGTNNAGFADSGIVAEGANTAEPRLSGGENQAAPADGGAATMAGENAYTPPPEQTAAAQQVDAGGNDAQAAAEQAGNEAGGDNNNNAAEEAAVAEGAF